MYWKLELASPQNKLKVIFVSSQLLCECELSFQYLQLLQLGNINPSLLHIMSLHCLLGGELTREILLHT